MPSGLWSNCYIAERQMRIGQCRAASGKSARGQQGQFVPYTELAQQCVNGPELNAGAPAVDKPIHCRFTLRRQRLRLRTADRQSRQIGKLGQVRKAAKS